ncbi:transcriptional regulator RcsB [Serratia quinivorans]|jgi:DNA-binding NarL/FixJ family response regulator|uniref:LuxR C-terminal-related transcriptional regulator n=1 Tax=Serratia quinivorans TaxID=137545 RepID=A0ABV3UGH2_9GAMM|nr:LuxR C-terminal-related transcriptional regulator [Serratia quinivorans]CAI1564941.1 transcriptional regulator RcsB [Serratia quinivorans]CAI1698424.1 transcriptional regulator RcsB [Serratia quinivorans]CAI1722104.1 transcriptional regulator RcsB [Serratia quinivorans]
MKNYRIALLESCQISRLGYQAFCETYEDVSTSLVANSIEDYKALLFCHDFDVAIVDPINPKTGLYHDDIFAFLEYFHQRYPEKPLILYSDDAEFFDFYSYLYKHPWIMVDKKSPLFELYAAITNDDNRRPGQLFGKPLLTCKERVTLRLIMKGYKSSQVAKILNCSIKTVSSHKSSALKKIFFIKKTKPYLMHPATLFNIPRFIYSVDN